jgi:hypothetical protein
MGATTNGTNHWGRKTTPETGVHNGTVFSVGIKTSKIIRIKKL